MIKILIKIFLIIILLVLGVIFSTAFMVFFVGADYKITINDKYEMIRIYGGAVLLVDRNDRTIGPNVDGYLIFDEYIIGHVSHEQLPKEDKEYSTPGYFIVNLADNSVLQGLDETEYTAELIKRKIQTDKKLHKPSRFDEYFKGGVVKNKSVK